MNNCPTCGKQMPNEADTLRSECLRLGIPIRFPDLVGESGAAELLGYAGADTLRKQCSDQRNLLDYVRRGNRRFYSLAEIALYMQKP